MFTLGTIVAFQRFLETDRARWLLGSAACFAFAGVTKENAYMTGVLFVTYGLWCLVRTAPSPAGPKPGAALAAAWRWTAPRIAPILSAGILFLVIWAAMYTAFGKYPGDWLAIPKAVKYWMGQHAIARIPGPWWYYFPQLVYYDTAILFAAAFAFRARDWRSDPLLRTLLVATPLLAAYAALHAWKPAIGGPAMLIAFGAFLAGFVIAGWVLKPPPESTLPPFLQFVAFWAVGSLAIYAWAREKVPWLTVHPLLPLTILAGLGVARLWEERRRPLAGTALAVTGLLLAVNTWGAYLAAFRYGAHDVEKEPGHAEMLAYVQTSKDLVRSLRAVDQAKARVPAGQNVVTVAGEAAWPLTWYLRDAPTAWASRIEQAATPIIIADWDAEGALEKQLAEKYDARRVPIRAWWFPEIKKEGGKTRPTLGDLARLWLFHEIWSPIGSQDATVYVRKDLGGSGMLEPLTVEVQDTSARDYPSEALELPAGRAFGVTGAGPGQLSEPRGVAVDAQRQPLRRRLEEQPHRDLRRQRRVHASGRLRRRRGAAQGAERRRRGTGRDDLRRGHLEPSRGAVRAQRGVARGVARSRQGLLRSARGGAVGRLALRDRHGQQARRAFRPRGQGRRQLGRRRATVPGSSSSPSASRPTPAAASTSPTPATIACRSSRPTAGSCASSRSTDGRTSTRSLTSPWGRPRAFS